MARLSAVGLEFFAFHGCHPLEQKTGGEFIVDIHIDGDFSDAKNSDNIDDAIDYVTLMEISKEQMAIRCNLIETVSKNIGEAIAGLLSAYDCIEVTVYKMKVPLRHKSAYVSVNHIIKNNKRK